MKKIIIAGGTGNIGKLLVEKFLKLNYQVVILSRHDQQSKKDGLQYVKWDGETIGEWVDVLEKADAVINLSGKSIQCRFTEENKKALLSSRVKPTAILGKAIEQSTTAPRLWINFSGISVFEGIKGENDEYSTNYANTFLANLTKQWEETFFKSNTPETTKVCLRLSPVLSKDFGMFKELYPLAKLGLGGKVGDGEQLISWIHELDLVELVVWILNQEKPSHTYHACVSNPISNKQFMKDLRTVVGTPFGMPLPAPLAKVGAFFKGVESDMLLLTNNVSTTKTIEEGFVFTYPNTIKAFKHLTKN